jgi:WD40 repeat protein
LGLRRRFSHDGQRLVTVSRDRAVKLIDIATGRLIDDVNKPREALLCLARHPSEDLVVSGSENGEIRLHRMARVAGRLSEGDDKEHSFVREFERLSGPVHALAFSPDGKRIAAGGAMASSAFYEWQTGRRSTSNGVREPFRARLSPARTVAGSRRFRRPGASLRCQVRSAPAKIPRRATRTDGGEEREFRRSVEDLSGPRAAVSNETGPAAAKIAFSYRRPDD